MARDASSARWIWTALREYVNQHVYFRKRVELPAAPRRAAVRVTADTRFRLWVNGRLVLRGPPRGFPHSQPCDELDLAPFLHAGANVVAAHVLSFGISTSQNVFRDRAGFFLEGAVECDGGASVELDTNHTWRCIEAAAYARCLPRVSMEIGFQEHFDAAKEPAGWTTPDYDNIAWAKPSILGALGVLPWRGMEPRNIPPIRTAPVAAPQAPPELLSGDELRTVRVDFGDIRFGYPSLRLSGAVGGEVIGLIYSEDPYVPQASCACDSLICKPGDNYFESLQPRGFRYLTLVASNLRQPLKIERLELHEISYPAPQRGSFSCSDPRLNAIWETSVRTLRRCMADSFMDSPLTQAQGWAAARIAGNACFYTLGDSALFKRGLRLMAQSQLSDGLLIGVAPSERGDCVLLDYCLHWIAALDEYYQFTGDLETLKEHRNVLEKLLGFFSILAGERGLLGPAPNYALFLDWAPGLDRGNLSATFNLLYLHALRRAARIGAALGDSGLASHCARQAETLADRILMVFASSHRSLLVETVELRTGEPGDLVSQHATALAVIEGVLGRRDEDQRGPVAEVLGDFLPPPGAEAAPGPVRANLFFRAYVHEALAVLQRGDLALQDIRRAWGYMLDQGATTWWERLPLRPGAARCHAWSVHPATFLSRHVLGVAPLQPGFKRFAFRPQLFDLTSAEGKIPTPRGEIAINLRADEKTRRLAVELTVPEGTEAELPGPGEAPPRAFGPGNHRFEI